MQPQFDNQVMSSFLLWLDNKILTKGQAFTNYGSNFYPIKNRINGYYTYACPFKPLISDFSISGANVPTGLYVNGNFIGIGQSGLVDINYEQGQAYFTSQVNTVSGNYSIPDVSIRLTDAPEETLLFETKFSKKPKTVQTATGLAVDTETYPVIFLKNDNGENVPFAFGGLDKTLIYIRGIILMDSQFNLDAVNSILRDTNLLNVPLINPSEMPFNGLGGFRNGTPYNYTGLTAQKAAKNEYIYISKVYVSKFEVRNSFLTEIKGLNPEVYSAFVDFNLEIARYPRQA